MQPNSEIELPKSDPEVTSDQDVTRQVDYSRLSNSSLEGNGIEHPPPVALEPKMILLWLKSVGEE